MHCLKKLAVVLGFVGSFVLSARAAAIQGGDTDTTKGPDDICIFNTTGDHTLTVNEEVANVEILIVAGGGGGGKGKDYAAGGGGGGGVVQLKCQTLTAGSYSLTVGAAGLGATTTANGGNGGSSTFNDGTTVWTAVGGGGGGREKQAVGNSGGSGGGASKAAGGASTQNKYDGCGFGNAGGNSDSSGTPSGGGGAGGSPANNSAVGGPGLVFGTSGTRATYGAGGTAGGTTSANIGSGGGSIAKGNGRDGTAGAVIVRVRRKVDISDATVTIPAQTWTGSPIHPTKEEIEVVDSISGNTVDSSNYDLEYLTDCVTQGVHTVRIIGKNNAFETNDAPFRIVLPTVYVATTGDDANDGTEAHPFKTIAYAIEAQRAGYKAGYTDPLKISIAAGTHASPFATLNFPVTLEGNVADPSQVKINDSTTGKRAFTISNGSVVLSGLTIQGTGLMTNDKQGGHIYMSAGTISDCIVKDGRAAGNGSGFGGNIYMTGGKVVRTKVLDGRGHNQDNSWISQGCNVYMAGGTLENCLVKGGYSGCTTATPEAKKSGYGAGVYASGTATIVNCTIVGNSSRLDIYAAGVYLADSTVRVLNCVIYGNGGTTTAEWGNRNGARYTNCGFGAGLAPAAGFCCIDTVTDAAFTDYANGDLTLVENSALADRGSIVAADIALAGTLDLAKNPRAIGIPDVGAYEYQVVGFAVRASSATLRSVVGTQVAFTATNYNASAAVTYTWNFGDGSASVSGAEVAHAYTAAGHYTVTVTGTAGGSETSYTLPYTIAVVNPLATDIYVSPSGNDYSGDGSENSPLATITYAASIMKAAGSSGATIHVGPGTVKDYGIVLDFAVTVQGEGATRADTIVDAASAGRAFKIAHADALVKNLTVQNGKATSSASGGNIYLSAGTLKNCVVKNGVVESGTAGNIYIAGGTVEDCVFSGGTFTGKSCHGIAVSVSAGRFVRCTFQNTTKSGPVDGDIGVVYVNGNTTFENCLFKNNSITGLTSTSTGKGYFFWRDSGILTLINCTIVKNTIVAGKAASLFYSPANLRAYNCVIYDNGGTAAKEWGNSSPGNYVKCAFAANASYTGTTSTVTDLTDADFADYANADYHPAKTESQLKKAGSTKSEYKDTYGATSDTDIEGTTWGNRLDIGCYAAPAKSGLIFLIR